jgi:glycosyltransferase involved in cell wall biosynthesis
MNVQKPLLSIGMPLYNAENYLREALDSILKQSFKDFELIISDNGSTDSTQKICENYARKDKRIKYIRHEKNKGAAWNFNYVVGMAEGKYFKWAAHDDNLAKDFLKECINVLEKNDDIILVYAKAKIIDGQGKVTELYSDKLNLTSPKINVRYKMFHRAFTGHFWCNAVFGVIRLNILKKTHMIRNFISSDVVLLGELSLYGKMYEISEYLFYQRIHPENSTHANVNVNERVSWFDPSKSGKLILTRWRHLFEYAKDIFHVKMRFIERISCCWEVKKWCWRNKRGLFRETAKFFLWPIILLLKNSKKK